MSAEAIPLYNCPACGRYCSAESGYADHERQACVHRNPGHECVMDGCGLDVCHCDLTVFCDVACAERWHGGAR